MGIFKVLDRALSVVSSVTCLPILAVGATVTGAVVLKNEVEKIYTPSTERQAQAARVVAIMSLGAKIMTDSMRSGLEHGFFGQLRDVDLRKANIRDAIRLGGIFSNRTNEQVEESLFYAEQLLSGIKPGGPWPSVAEISVRAVTLMEQAAEYKSDSPGN